jgi:hypothetical protein
MTEVDDSNISSNPVFLLGYNEYIVASLTGKSLYIAIIYKNQ